MRKSYIVSLDALYARGDVNTPVKIKNALKPGENLNFQLS